MKERILENAFQLFSTVGYSNVAMDDIARRCGVGKATIYKYYPSKKALMLASADFITAKVEAEIGKAFDDASLTPRQRMGAFLRPVLRLVTRINRDALADLQRSAPEAYERIDANRRRLILQNIVRVVEEGKAAGLLRPDLDGMLTAHVLIGALSHLSRPEVLEEIGLPLGRLLDDVFTLLWEGGLSEEGRVAEG